MELSRSRKIMLGVLSIWPFVWIFIFMVIVFSIFVFNPSTDNGFPVAFIPVMIIHVLTCCCSLGLMIYFLIHAAKNVKLTQEMKIVWIILLAILTIYVNPFYWYMNIWKEQTTV